MGALVLSNKDTIFSFLSDAELQSVLPFAREIQVVRGYFVQREMVPETLYFVKEGEISLRSNTQLDFGRVRAGRTIEMKSVINAYPNWDFFWRAEEDSVLLAIPWFKVMEILQHGPRFEYLRRVTSSVEIQKFRRDLRVFGMDRQEISEVIMALRSEYAEVLLRERPRACLFVIITNGEIDLYVKVNDRRKHLGLIRVGDHAVLDLGRDGKVMDCARETYCWYLDMSEIASLQCAAKLRKFVDAHLGRSDDEGTRDETVWMDASELTVGAGAGAGSGSVESLRSLHFALLRPLTAKDKLRRALVGLTNPLPVDVSWAMASALNRLAKFHGFELGVNYLKRCLVGFESDSATAASIAVFNALNFDCGLVPCALWDQYPAGFPALAYSKSRPLLLLRCKDRKVRIEFLDTGERRTETIHDLKQAGVDAAIMIAPNLNTEDQPDSKISIWSYLTLLLSTKRRFAFLYLATSLSFGFDLAIPMFIQVFYSKVIEPHRISAGAQIIIGYFGVRVLAIILSWLERSLDISYRFNMEGRLASAYLRRVGNAAMSFFDTMDRGDLLSRYDSLGEIQNDLSSLAHKTLRHSLSVILCGVLLWLFNPAFVYAAAVILPVFFLAKTVMGPVLGRNNIGRQEHLARERTLLIELFDAVEETRAQNGALTSRWKWEENCDRSNFFAKKIVLIHASGDAIDFFAKESLKLVGLWIGVHLFFENHVSLGQVISCFFLMERIVDPVWSIFEAFYNLPKLRALLNRLDAILTAPQESSKAQEPGTSERVETSVPILEFKDVAFKFSPISQPVLKRISFSIAREERLAIVGQSGSGKSTLVSLMNGLRAPTSGEVLLNGRPLKAVGLAQVRSEIGFVSQDGELLSGSLLENITMDPNGDMQRAMSASRLSGCDDFISRLPNGYLTHIEKGGVGLSEGQTQSVLLARALYSQHQVLIMDESTSHFDTISEERLIENLIAREKKKTLIFVTRHINLLARVDKILFINHGEVEDYGSHHDLMSRCAAYRTFFTRQLALH